MMRSHTSTHRDGTSETRIVASADDDCKRQNQPTNFASDQRTFWVPTDCHHGKITQSHRDPQPRNPTQTPTLVIPPTAPQTPNNPDPHRSVSPSSQWPSKADRRTRRNFLTQPKEHHSHSHSRSHSHAADRLHAPPAPSPPARSPVPSRPPSPP